MQRFCFRNCLATLVAASLVSGLFPQPSCAQPVADAEYGADSGFGDAEGAGAEGGTKTMGVVALSGWNPLLEDIDYLAALGGRPDQAQSIEGMIAFFTQGKGLVGLDKTKPWGVVVQGEGMSITPIVCLPVDDLPGVLALAQAFGVMSADAGGGVTELTAPQSPAPLFAKQVGSWTYLSQTAESLDSAPADPTAMLTDLVKDYDLGARGYVQNIPAMFRELAISSLKQGLEEGLEQEPDETDDAFETRKRMAQLQFEQIETLVEQLDQITLGIGVNESAGDGILLDFTATGLDGSDLAEQISAMGVGSTSFAGFIDEDATMQMTFASETPKEIMAKQADQLKGTLTVVRKQVMDAIENEADVPNEEAREALKSAASDLLGVYEEIVMSGVADGAMAVTLAPDTFKMAGGAKVPSPAKVESALKKLAAVMAKEGAPDVAWGAHTHDGVTFHAIEVPVPPEARQDGIDPFGETLPVAVGIGADSVYLAAGSDWLANVTAAMDASKASGPTAAKPASLSISVESIVALGLLIETDPQRKQVVQMFADALGESDGDDHVLITVDSIERGMRYRIQVEEGVLRGAGVMAEAAARQAGAGGPPAF
ncbi:MAG: hypothetical protein AAGB00_06320 [Planctomycetota bacterium]